MTTPDDLMINGFPAKNLDVYGKKIFDKVLAFQRELEQIEKTKNDKKIVLDELAQMLADHITELKGESQPQQIIEAEVIS